MALDARGRLIPETVRSDRRRAYQLKQVPEWIVRPKSSKERVFDLPQHFDVQKVEVFVESRIKGSKMSKTHCIEPIGGFKRWILPSDSRVHYFPRWSKTICFVPEVVISDEHPHPVQLNFEHWPEVDAFVARIYKYVPIS